jgi:hypothetical protein
MGESGNPGEIVCSEETNPSLYSTVFNELILCYHTNIILNKLREEHPRIVGKLETILKTERGGEIAAKIHEAQVFAVPTLVHHLAAIHNLTYREAKPYVYEIKQTLEIEKIIEWTPYKAVHPNPKHSGPRAHFYKIVGIDLNGPEDPLVKKAQREYEEAPLSYDKQAQEEWSAKDRLSKISRLIADQLIENGHLIINPTQVLKICKDSYRGEIQPAERQDVIRFVGSMLKEQREGCARARSTERSGRAGDLQ